MATATATAMAASDPTAIAPASDDDDLERRVLARTNALLGRLGFGDRAFARGADLVASVSSMSVALFEKLFERRLRGVERVPRTRQEYARNAQLVVDALSGALLDDGDHDSDAAPLSGECLCDGDWDAIARLVEQLERVLAILDDGGSMTANEPRDDDRERGKRETKRKARRRRIKREDAASDADNERDGSDASRLTSDEVVEPDKQAEIRAGHAPENSHSHSSVASSRSIRVSEGADPEATTAAKKRSRVRENSSFRSSRASSVRPLSKSLHSQRGEKALSRSARVPDRPAIENELLQTQKYGRFVGAASHSSGLKTQRRRRQKGDEEGLSMSFGGVSSVSNASNSVHFLDEGSALAQDFSAMSIDSLRNNAGDRSTRSARRTREGRTVRNTDHSDARSRNQQEAAAQDGDASGDAVDNSEATASPAKKKVARDLPPAPEPLDSSRVIHRDLDKSLYPLLSRSQRGGAASKAQTQYLRYKMTLKDHLQELRQVCELAGFHLSSCTHFCYDAFTARVLPAAAHGARVPSRNAHGQRRQGAVVEWLQSIGGKLTPTAIVW